ncbi:MAG: hypothetical protein ACFFE4_18195 [Candidatus Thorarchaeota archaeon]
MKSGKLTIFYIAKYANYELSIEGMMLKTGLDEADTPEKIKRRNWALKLRNFRTKILYAIIFGILPVVPLLGYFEIADILINSLIAIDLIIFHGSLFLGLFFTLQFFNFILMGMLEVGTIISSPSFEWLKTLPIPRNKLKKIMLLTIFRSFDIPLIVIIVAFPVVMYIGTSSVIILLISIGISIINAVFSFSILIIIGSRMSRILVINRLNSRKSHAIRILNFLIYAVVILGSMYLIQWAFSSIDAFFIMFMNLDSPAQTNLILSSIPYPFNPCYLILDVIVANRTPEQLWWTSIIGFVILILITFGIFKIASHQIKKLAFLEVNNSSPKKEIHVDIKTTTPFRAHLRKDIAQMMHDFKSFITIITTFLLSFLFSYYFNLNNIGRFVPTETLIYTTWVGLLLISPIISTLLIFNFLSFEETGQSILTSLPIIPRDQARAKLFLILIFQTSAVLFPTLMYIADLKFSTLFLATLAAIPLIWIFTLILFETKVNYFGKKRDYYVIEEVNPTNRMFKWTIILCLQYIVSFWIISFTFNLYMFFNFAVMLSFWIFVSVIGLIASAVIFLQMFPKISIASIVRRDVRKWFSLNFNRLINTIVKQSLEKEHLLSFKQSIKIIWEEYFLSNPNEEDRAEELEILIDAMINGIYRVAKRIFQIQEKIPRI